MDKQTKVTLISPESNYRKLSLSELWSYRELYYFLSWRDIKVRFAQTILGVAWVVLQPLLTMLVFTIFFGRFVGINPEGVPYSLFALTGLIPWIFFSNNIVLASSSLLGDANLIKKVYFPRIILPSAKILVGLVDLSIFCCILVFAIPFFDEYYFSGLRLLLFPFVMAVLLLFATGIGILLAGLNMLFRDIKHIVPFLVQIWLFLTPIAYPLSVVPEKWQLLYGINPMVGITEAFRWVVLENYILSPNLPLLFSMATVISLAVFVLSIQLFQSVEKGFADTI